MIQFPCKCGYAFEVPEDLAGGLIQCPECHLLADVPLLGDLSNLNADGTFSFESSIEIPDTMTAADLHRVFTNKTVDSHGREKDLRQKVEHLAAVGVQDQRPMRVAPRYDPETGELVRPLQLKEEQPIPVLSLATEVDPADVDQLDTAAVPMPVLPIQSPATRPPSLAYATGTSRQHVTLKTLAIELLGPGNATVMLFIYVMYVMGRFATLALATYVQGFLLTVRPFLLLNVPIWVVLAHLGCTIEATGPDAFDELPRPLRDFSIGEDFLTPLFRTVLALLICFAPACFTFLSLDAANPMTGPINLIFLGIGLFLFPAVVLTTVTGVTILNLRPDRVAKAIQLGGMQYIASIALFTLAFIPSVFYLGNELLFHGKLGAPMFQQLERPAVMLPALAVAVYVLHFFAWHLGMMYRANHANFPWLAQRHERAVKPETRNSKPE